MTYYTGAMKYWDQVFDNIEEYDPREEVAIPEIEEGISWICKDSKLVLDFGFGTGKVVFRCLTKGVKKVYGIDISSSAVRLAESVAAKNDLKERVKFTQGSVAALKDLQSSTYDGIILFNVLDSLKPDHAMEVIFEAKRILKPNGKVLVKLNPYLIEEKIISFERLGEEFYLEETGLYLWNLSNQRFEDVIRPNFDVEKLVVVEFKHKMTNRMYYLRNRTRS